MFIKLFSTSIFNTVSKLKGLLTSIFNAFSEKFYKQKSGGGEIIFKRGFEYLLKM